MKKRTLKDRLSLAWSRITCTSPFSRPGAFQGWALGPGNKGNRRLRIRLDSHPLPIHLLNQLSSLPSSYSRHPSPCNPPQTKNPPSSFKMAAAGYSNPLKKYKYVYSAGPARSASGCSSPARSCACSLANVAIQIGLPRRAERYAAPLPNMHLCLNHF